jgi:hypothetical protein
MLAAGGVIAIAVNVALVTNRAALPPIEPQTLGLLQEALILATPALTPLASPLLSTVAIDASDDAQATSAVRF